MYYLATGVLSAAFGSLYIWASENFPITVRTRCLTLQSLSGRLGCMSAPFVVDIGKTSPTLAVMLFGVPCIIAGCLDMLVPETRGRELPNSFADIYAWDDKPNEVCAELL
eukprot:TRINITY_DN1214_c1_g1_i1.p1 TRINITY_DN1214_c1_g1~~TRINITY_DN1214_c1_g1_i1.p1  ORF type:complete len:110 (+),score=12.59 TRINITY_DN1214_c1_g1_i1:208-537(+)